MPTDFKVNKVLCFFPPLLLFCTRLICKDTIRREVSGVCLSTQKCFRKTLKLTVPVSWERGLQKRNSLLCRTLYCDISTLSHSLPTAGSTHCQLNTLKQGLPTAGCAAATEIQSNQESLPGFVFKETIIFEAMLVHCYTKQILRITIVPCKRFIVKVLQFVKITKMLHSFSLCIYFPCAYWNS